MFTHPANPQGTLFSRQQLCSMIQWCLRNKHDSVVPAQQAALHQVGD
jgi:bifunctional pyridoxal-dependent enzyme with beta-cystathionase and maltose regulon repressor activities